MPGLLKLDHRRQALRWDGFISYKNSPPYAPTAAALCRALGRYSRFWFQLPGKRIFLDDVVLAAPPDLLGKLDSVVDASDYFILLASPEAAQSLAVQGELSRWLSRVGGAADERLIIVLLSGKIERPLGASDFDWAVTDALPPQLRRVLKTTPQWVNLSTVRPASDLSLKNSDFARAVHQISARLRGLTEQQLSRALARRRWGARVSVAAVLMLVAAVVVTAIWADRSSRDDQADRDAAAANANLAADPERSILLALEAVRTSSTMGAQNALRRAVAASHLRAVVSHLPVGIQLPFPGLETTAVAMSGDGRLLLTGGPDGLGRLTDVRSGKSLAMLRSNGGTVLAVAMTADGRYAAMSTASGEILLWDTRSSRSAARISEHTGAVGALAFNPDGTLLASGGRDGIGRIWKVPSGSEMTDLSGHSASIRSVAFSHNGSRLVTASEDHSARAWDVISGRSQFVFAAHRAQVTMAVFSSDDAQIATASGDGSAKVWDSTTGELVRSFEESGEVNSVQFSTNGADLLTASTVQTTIWRVATGQRAAEFRGQNYVVWSAVYSPDEQSVLTASEDGTVWIWDVNSGDIRAVLRGHRAGVHSAVYSPDGRWIVSGSADGTARLWETLGNEVRAYQPPVAVSPSGRLALTFASDGSTIVQDRLTGARVSTFRDPTGQPPTRAVFGAADQQVVVEYRNGTAWAHDLSGSRRASEGVPLTAPGFLGPFSPDGRWLVEISLDGGIRLWNTGQWRPVVLFASRARDTHVAFSPDSRFLAFVVDNSITTGRDEQRIRVVRTVDWSDAALLGGRYDAFGEISFDRSGRTLGAINRRTIGLWDARTWNGLPGLPNLTGASDQVGAFGLSPDGQTLITADSSGTARRWDVRTGRELLPGLRGHSSAIRSIEWSPDGRELVTASVDGTVRLWNAQSGDSDAVLEPEERLQDAHFAESGEVLSRGEYGDLYVFTQSITVVQAIAEHRVSRQLTCDERTAYLHQPCT